MKITCKVCNSRFSLSDDQVFSFATDIVIECPECRVEVIIHRGEAVEEIEAGYVGLPYGDELKRNILDTLEELPAMPQVVVMARQIVSDPESNFMDLARVIETDQAIATRVLKLANSAYYSVSGNVANIQQAAVKLGTNALYELLTLACTAKVLNTRLPGYELDTNDLWKHSLTVAAAARIIARESRPDLEETAFSVGLIHDSGKLILDRYIAERRVKFCNFVEHDEIISFLSLEKKILGFSHAEMAAAACERWHFPQKVIDGVRYHHKPSLSPQADLAAIVHLADAAALMSGFGIGFDGLLYEFDEAVYSQLDIQSERMNDFIAEASEYGKEISEHY